jgi:hypothetical protein
VPKAEDSLARTRTLSDTIGLAVGLGAIIAGVVVVIGGVRTYSFLSTGGASWAFWLASTIDLGRNGAFSISAVVIGLSLTMYRVDHGVEYGRVRMLSLMSLFCTFLFAGAYAFGVLIWPAFNWSLMIAFVETAAAFLTGVAFGYVLRQKTDATNALTAFIFMSVTNTMYCAPMAAGVVEGRLQFSVDRSTLPKVEFGQASIQGDWRLVFPVEGAALLVRLGPTPSEGSFVVAPFDALRRINASSTGVDITSRVFRPHSEEVP